MAEPSDDGALSASAPPSTEQVRIQLSTRDPSVDIPPTGPILVSTSLRRYALSTLVNTLRETQETPTPFSFLVDGRFLTTSLGEYLAEHGRSAEAVLHIEYLLADLPPTPQAAFEHDDWVASVDVLSATCGLAAPPLPGHERILSASYDGIARVWDMSGAVVASTARPASAMPAHLLAARFLSAESFATAGFDSHIRLYSLPSDASTPLEPTLSLLGHRHVITSLSAPANGHFLSASADHTALLWSTSLDPAAHAPVPTTLPAHIAAPPAAKRAKHARAGPAARLAQHTRPVSAALFAPHDASVAYTAAHDRQLLTWDLATAALVSARTPAPNEPLTAAAALPRHPGVVVAGTGTGSVLVVDVREGVRRTAVARGRGHRAGITAVDVGPATAGGARFVTAARAGSEVFTWDLRNTSGALAGDDEVGARGLRPVFKLERQRRKEGTEEEKKEGWGVFGLRWDEQVGIVSGGADARVQVDR